MKRILFFLMLFGLENALHAQQPYVYTIKADSVKITNTCDTAELIIENHTQNVPGFLFNKGRGRTEFRRVLQKINDTLVTIGVDSLRLPYAWVQGGNKYGTIGKFGTLDNNPVDFYINDTVRGRWTTTGNLIVGNSVDKKGFRLQVNGGSYFNGTQDITGSWIDSNKASHTRYYPDLTNAGTDWSEIYGMLISPTINFTANNQLGCALKIEPNFKLNGTSQYVDAISSALYIRSLLGGIKITQSGSVYGNAGQPLFIEQDGTSDKELILNYRNHNGSTRAFIWNNDTRPQSNSAAMVPSIRSSIGYVTAGGGVSYTMDRFYYGTEAAMEMKYESTPGGDTPHTRNTSIALKTMSSGSLYTSLYLFGDKVGMGTTMPSAQLHTTGSVRFAGLTNDNSLARIVVSDANGNLFFRDALTVFNETINSDLAVNGRVSAQKMLITQTGRWPDYVFSKQYQLPSLTEVESFIKQNNHLPGIPSAAEVEKKGIDVGTNQAVLLQKVEELTLYAIEQNKTIQKQNEEMAELKKMNKDMDLLKQQLNELRALIYSKDASVNSK